MATMTSNELITLAIQEDFGRGDVTAEAIFDEGARASGEIVAKEAMVLAGGEVAREVFARVDAEMTFDLIAQDGETLEKGQVVAFIEGRARSVLAAERTALNFLQRLSGIATLTRQFVDAVSGTKTRVCDTRKTAPGFRALDKHAVKMGGGHNHRADLASGILIKDNHIAALGSVKAAVARAKANAPHSLRIEVEVTALDQIEDALTAGAEILLLDNMIPERVAEAVARIGGRALTEVSGGVRLENIRAYAVHGVDYISVGALTHSARAVDLSLEVAFS